jgi:LysM repeat protein
LPDLNTNSPSMMRRLFARLGGLCLLALLTAGCQRTFIFVTTPTSPAKVTSSAAERTATITQIKGTVETRTSSNGNWTRASQDQLFSEGNEIRTGPGATAVIGLTEGSHIYLASNTQFTLTLLNPFLDSQLTTLDLQNGQVWVLLTGGALDVQTPFPNGIASARNAYMSVELQPQSRVVNVTCLQGVCGFGSVLILPGYKLANAVDNQSPEQMQMADYGAWGVAVPEATQLAFLATEAVVQGSATIPAVASPTATASPRPTVTRRPTASATPTLPPTETETQAPNNPSPTTAPASQTPTLEPPTETPTETQVPSHTPVPLPTLRPFRPSVTPVPFTPLPPAPIIGRHVVQGGETIFCIARGYGVLPGAIAQANGLSQTFFLALGQVLLIPAVQWTNIAAGPVCATQFQSPFPGLLAPTGAPPASPTQAGRPLAVSLNVNCTANCGSKDGDYELLVDVLVSGGVQPYIYDPAQSYVLILPHCTTGQVTARVTSADGQTAQTSKSYDDVSCR